MRLLCSHPKKSFLKLSLAFLIAGIFYSQESVAQVTRYLERKGYEPKPFDMSSFNDGFNITMINPSLDKGNERIAISIVDVHGKNEMIKASAYSSILNLANGKSEKSMTGSSFYFFGDKAFLTDFQDISGRWVKAEEFSSALSDASYIYNPETNSSQKIEIPAGHTLTNIQGKYLLTTNVTNGKSAIIEIVNGESKIRGEFSL